ncbi:hypothetical protein VTP01DRAFT_7131 [Rhizomucor pusillus]|uniref:uncharacterized protein n=1 Tax=Rhizomucor pusillus TaxID=4840 RepID=UPI0037449497
MDYVIDEELYALQTVSSHTGYLRTLSSERNHEFVAKHVDEPKDKDVYMRETTPKRNYTTYTNQDKVRFFRLMFEKVLSASVAAKQLGIHVRSAQRSALRYEKDPDSIFKKRKNSGRPRILNDEHKKVILECVDENPSIVLEQLMERLLQRFEGLKVSKTTLHRFVRKWDMTDIDFRKNCVFLDESAFHINMKRSMAWSKKGSSAVVTLETSTAPAKKRKRAGHSEAMSRGTVTGHYLSFLKATMDEMDKYEQMKGYYLVMDNAPIHKADDISRYIESRGYRCAYLSSYSPELNPIEQFWSVVKSKVKRNSFLESETLMTRISEASNSLKLSDFKGFVSHSYRCLDNCRNGEQL